MPNPVLLNNVDHLNLRVKTNRGAQYGENEMVALTFPAEFRELQGQYPIVFRKSDDGDQFYAMALLGLMDGENLYLSEERWEATYVPLSILRQPFLIGVGNGDLLVHIDLDNTRVNETEGEALFLPHGGSTEFLERMNSLLFTLHQGLESMGPFTKTLLELDLLESFVVDIELKDGSQNRFAGFYTINEESLAKLNAETLDKLHKNGYLQAIYMALASLQQFRGLIERKNRRNAA